MTVVCPNKIIVNMDYSWKIILGTAVTCFILSKFTWAESQGQQCSINKITGFVNCRDKELVTVPNIPTETKVIDLSENNIQNLNATAFHGCPFVSEIYLANNKLSFIPYTTFSGLQVLKILDISHNQLTNFHVDIPVALEILYLDYNPLVNHDIFQQRLLYLKYLSLVGTQLTQQTIFSNFLPVLQYLDLQNISTLTLNSNDLKKLNHLRVLYVSPRMFSGRNKSQKCKEFVQAAREFKTEVKGFSCFPQETFEIKARSFERVYQVDEAMYDHPDKVLNKESNESTCIHDLQDLVSDGVTNFVKSILVQRRIQLPTFYKIKEPIKLEDFFKSTQISLTDMSASGFPGLKPQKNPILNVASSDAEELKRFRFHYQTTETNFDITISGHYNFYGTFGNFSCRFMNTNYETARQMLRRYDFLIWPTNIRERLDFEKMACHTSQIDHTDQVIEMVLTGLSRSWLDTLSHVVHVTTIEPQILEISRSFTDMYRRRILSFVIGKGIEYLKNISVNSFDVAPFLSNSPNDTEIQFGLEKNVYNVKINNMFNYVNNNINYTTSEEGNTMKIVGKYVIEYDPGAEAVLSVSAKENPNDIMIITIKNIEFDVVFYVKTINKVNKLTIGDVTALVTEKDSERSLIFLMLKKYLGIELAREFERSLVFLTSNIDFYSLNAL